MRTALFGIAAAVLTASPVFATDFPVPRYSESRPRPWCSLHLHPW